VVLDHHHPSLVTAQGDSLLDAWLFAADNAAIKTARLRRFPLLPAGARTRRIVAGG
jgi:formimidoylglutamate deiminase